MSLSKKAKICKLLKGIETGDPEAASVVNEAQYIQHNPQTHEGSEGLAALFKRLSKTSPRVNIVRIFAEGEFVFAHTEYDFATRNIGFEIFRFEQGQAVEHWDNIQIRKAPNDSAHSMVDGAIEATEHDKTASNRAFIQSFVNEVLIHNKLDALHDYINARNYIEHSPDFSDDLMALRAALSHSTEESHCKKIIYQQCHRLLAEGNFILSVCEGYSDNTHTSFYDLYRVEQDQIVEHWGTTEAISPRSEWKNNNGKF